MKRVMIAILSTLCFGLIMILVSAVFTQSLPYQYLVIYAMYSAPVYFLGAIPTSFFIDRLIAQITFHSTIARYITKFILYGSAGMIAAFLYMMIIIKIEADNIYLATSDQINYMICGLIAALVYYHLTLLFNIRKGK